MKTPERMLRECEWISPQRIQQLERFGLVTVEDLLTHFPRRYEDRRQFDRFPAQESDVPVCVRGTVVKTSAKRLGGWKRLFEVVLEPEEAHALSQPLVCRWFNVHFVQKMIATGQTVVVYGKPKMRGKNICIDHPEFEVIEEGEEASVHLNRITPIYRATEGLSQRVIRSMTHRLVESLDELGLETRLPKELDPLPFAEALREIHFPRDHDSLARARRHLILDEFFSMQLFIAARRAETVSQPGKPHCGPGRLAAQFREKLPFTLTGAQKRVIGEIRADMASDRPMSRLLHGDVGSGKTVVALFAMLLAIESGCQAALMAPTQILAEQHYLNFCRWLEPLGIKLALRTGARKEETASFFDNSEARIVIGTHALLYDSAVFSNLGFIVIDEQHKFGVLQRARLIGQAAQAPDVLVMTATPIPRTLTMTLYGDLDVSTLDELPANRGKIVTAIRDETKMPEAIAFVRKHLEAGRQAYIVYPLIEESGKAELKAATREFEKWKEALRPMRCELLHGRIESEEKEAIMRRFGSGESKALVATSVIEVGIDVPNANIMLIENAERFGLAQLHQLRGRIGRGEHKSYCILITPASAPAESLEKLRVLERSGDGFEIAETDLRLRGPGDILGTAQSGLPPLKLGDPLADFTLIAAAREAATALFARDSSLERPENKRFRDLIARGRKRVLSQVS